MAAPQYFDSSEIVKELPVGQGRHIVVVRVSSRTETEQLAASEEVCSVLLRQKSPFAVLMDMRGLHDYPPTQRQMYANVRERLRPVYAQHHRLTVYLVQNDRQRGFVTAVGWQAKAGTSSGRVFTEDFKDAMARCEEALSS